jgi:hypothetical protein
MQFAQEKLSQRGEFYFKFKCADRDILDVLFVKLSIDKLDEDYIYAYANTPEFNYFLSHFLFLS